MTCRNGFSRLRPRIVEPWYVSKLRCTAMPPASAKAIASLIWRRSKYFSRIAADGTVRAQVARPLGVLRPKVKVPCGDAGRRLEHAVLDESVVRRYFVHLASPQIEQHEPGVGSSR